MALICKSFISTMRNIFRTMGTWQLAQKCLWILPITWPVDPAGNSRSAPPSRGPPPSYGGSGGGSRYDDYGSSSRDGYGSRDSYPSGRSESYSAGRAERPARQDLERGYPPRQYSSSSRGAPRGRGANRADRGMNRSRYWNGLCVGKGLGHIVRQRRG